MTRRECIIDGCTNDRAPGNLARRCTEHVAAAVVDELDATEGSA